MGNIIDKSESCCKQLLCPIQPETIHAILNKGYSIITNPAEDFKCRKKKILKLIHDYECEINQLYPYHFRYIRDCLGFEYLIFIGTIGPYAIDVVVYWDILGWVVLNEGTNYRRYDIGGGSKLQYSIAKRNCFLTEEQKCLLKAKEDEIIAIKESGKFCALVDKSSEEDFRCAPKCKILEPCNGAKVDCEFILVTAFKNWPLELGRRYKVYINGKCQGEFCEPEVCVRLHGLKKGWHKLAIKLCGNNACGKKYCCIRVKLCHDCCCSSSSSTSCSSSSSSSSKRLCSSWGSSCGCPSSSSSSSCGCNKCCSSSSSSSSCGCNKCCSSSSSSSSCGCNRCSSSSSSSCGCSKCCSSSSSSSSFPNMPPITAVESCDKKYYRYLGDKVRCLSCKGQGCVTCRGPFSSEQRCYMNNSSSNNKSGSSCGCGKNSCKICSNSFPEDNSITQKLDSALQELTRN